MLSRAAAWRTVSRVSVVCCWFTITAASIQRATSALPTADSAACLAANSPISAGILSAASSSIMARSFSMVALVTSPQSQHARRKAGDLSQLFNALVRQSPNPVLHPLVHALGRDPQALGDRLSASRFVDRDRNPIDAATRL